MTIENQNNNNNQQMDKKEILSNFWDLLTQERQALLKADTITVVKIAKQKDLLTQKLENLKEQPTAHSKELEKLANNVARLAKDNHNLMWQLMAIYQGFWGFVAGENNNAVTYGRDGTKQTHQNDVSFTKNKM